MPKDYVAMLNRTKSTARCFACSCRFEMPQLAFWITLLWRTFVAISDSEEFRIFGVRKDRIFLEFKMTLRQCMGQEMMNENFELTRRKLLHTAAIVAGAVAG